MRDLPLTIFDGDEGSWVDPLSYIPYLESRIARKDIKFGTAVLNTAFRRIEVVLKTIFTVQYLINNRFILGIGSGEKKEAFEILNVSWQDKDKNFEKWLVSLKRYKESMNPQGTKKLSVSENLFIYYK